MTGESWEGGAYVESTLLISMFFKHEHGSGLWSNWGSCGILQAFKNCIYNMLKPKYVLLKKLIREQGLWVIIVDHFIVLATLINNIL